VAGALMSALPTVLPADDRAWCAAMLPLVSRTFALSIRLLPSRLRHAVGVAYLLCRIADTCEDHPALPPATKARLLADFERALDAGAGDPPALATAFAARADAEELLAADCHRTLAQYRALPPAWQDAIRPWVQEMCRGMADYAMRPGAGGLSALSDLVDLDRYCYYVAGTVGHLLTELFRLHHVRLTARHHVRLRALATSFGLGLQLVNIIKDVADDRRRGHCFVPRRLCALYGITPEELIDPVRAAQARAVMDLLIAKARRHLHDALAYCCALPRSAYRIRLFCLTPLYFAVRTLERAAEDDRLLDPDHKVKITRGDVYRTLCLTYIVAPSNHLARGYFRRLAARARRMPPG
jgi:farnesyl-diphosphate farnesyltransferase